ncbi:hypothetical protein H4W33_005819 [Kibdelosporangium phytohabitans]|nr:hypothetical protein [Kibdelosporangium phytohabitans]
MNGSECVEVRADLGAVRDTKNPSLNIEFNVQDLVAAIRSGRLD